MNRMIFAGVAIIIVIGLAFLMWKRAPSAGAPSAVPEAQVQAEQQVGEISNKMETKGLPKPEMAIDTNKSYAAVLHTSEGDITIALNAAETPVTVNNFIYLARNNFYDNTIFHRVIEGFMVQGGDPTGTGTGSPGYRFDDEPITGEYVRGTVAMANSGPNTNGSQFFIMHADYPLPKNYVIFGKVSGGMEVVDKIATAETTVSMGGEKSKPVNPVTITSIDILEQ